MSYQLRTEGLVMDIECSIILKTIEGIAQKKLGIPTLKLRNSDTLDFYDIGVGSIREALEAAYRAGMDAGLSYYAVNQEDKAHD